MWNREARLFVLCVATVLVCAGVYVGFREASAPLTPCASVAVVDSAEREAAAVNRYRTRRGLRPLQRDARLESEAVWTARANASQGRLFHLGGNEIIAFNYSGFDDAIGQWHESPGHHALLNDGRFRFVGCACVRSGDRFFSCVRFR